MVLVACCKLAWSFLLVVEIWFGLSCLRWKLGVVISAYASPRPEIGFWSLLLAVPPVRKLGLVFSAYGSPTVSKKTNRKQNDLNSK